MQRPKPHESARVHLLYTVYGIWSPPAVNHLYMLLLYLCATNDSPATVQIYAHGSE